MDFPENAFWDFSLEIYGRDGVATACLALQDAHQADVNILLYGTWSGRQGVRLQRQEVECLMAAVGDWHGDVVRPLRQVRKRLKLPVDGVSPSPLQAAVRARLQKLEIDAEHIEQLRLHGALDGMDMARATPGADLAFENMLVYFGRLDASLDETARSAIAVIAATAEG